MKKLKGSCSLLLSFTMLSALMSGCAADTNNTGSYVGENTGGAAIVMIGDTPDANMGLFISFDDYIEFLKSKFSDDLDIEEILTNPECYSNEVQIIAGYINLLNHNLSVDDVAFELNNILVAGQVSRCLDEEEFKYITGKLLPTLNKYQNPFAAYLPLASSYHLFHCLEEHSTKENGVITCDILQEEYNKTYSEVSFEEYFDENIKDTEYYEIKEYLQTHPTVSMDDIYFEMELLFQYYVVENREFSDEGKIILFGLLLDINNGGDDTLEKYKNVAIKMHNLLASPEEVYEPAPVLKRYL